MMSLVPVTSPDLIVVTWGGGDYSGSGDDDHMTIHGLRTEVSTLPAVSPTDDGVLLWLQNITKIFSLMSSNSTDYDKNWRFQLSYVVDEYVTILTERGDLALTNSATLERRIGAVTTTLPDSQRFAIHSCSEDDSIS